jgi:hypothetical protein
MGTADRKKVRWYKITGPKGEPLYGGSGNWALPVGKKPGKWMLKVENVEACNAGYHLVEAVGIVEWLPRAPQTGLLWEAEGRGDSDKKGTKTAFAQARLIKPVGVLDEVSMRLAAADMAERVLPIFYKVHPKDNRLASAIQAARDFALGKIDDAAWDAARDAAWAAAWAAAAWAAARAAAGADAAWDAAKDAARAAAGADAAWDAAKDAAGGAAGADAAWDAAKDAAGGAAGADAAWDAARADAARAAAWAAAWDANAKIIIAQARKRKLALSE